MTQRVRIPVTLVIDEGVECVRELFSPWAGVLWLGVLPSRLLLVNVALALLDMRSAGVSRVGHVRTLTWLYVAAFVVAILARAVFARACHLGMRTSVAPGRNAVRLTLAEAMAHVIVGATALFLTSFTWVTVIALPLIGALHAIGVATAHDEERPSLHGPFARISRAAGASWAPLGLTLAFGVAWIAVMVGLLAATQIALWALAAVPGMELGGAHALTSLLAPHYLMLVVVVALTVIEPFWLASNVALARRLRAQESGEDLRAWLARLAAPHEHERGDDAA